MCAICSYADVHGHWPDMAPARTHCRGCHRSWARQRELHCGRCHAHFASAAAADAHLVERQGGLECLDAEAAGLTARPSDFGVLLTRGARARGRVRAGMPGPT